ncbi:MAG: sigma-70 family RNA polymerase sigma factor, partial [Vicingaceae bacterium]|nr:sigma-70 family RNA polymerase sigma factor [Vicingaceae bacterium]
SYAVWWIRQSIMQAIAEQARVVRLPLNKIGNITKINRAFSQLEQIHEREPSVDEVADILELTSSEVKDSLRISGRHISVDAPLSSDEESNTMIDVMSEKEGVLNPDRALMTQSLRDEIERSFSTLSYREAEVLRMYFGINHKTPLTLEEIGEQFSLTRERIRQIREKALRKLKHTSRCKLLKTYLG